MRIISLVPNGTEILFAVGAGDLVVGVSHECDFPPEARTRPILTGSALQPGMSAAEVDEALQVLADRRRTGPLTPEQREVMFGAKQYARH